MRRRCWIHTRWSSECFFGDIPVITTPERLAWRADGCRITKPDDLINFPNSPEDLGISRLSLAQEGGYFRKSYGTPEDYHKKVLHP